MYVPWQYRNKERERIIIEHFAECAHRTLTKSNQMKRSEAKEPNKKCAPHRHNTKYANESVREGKKVIQENSGCSPYAM